MEQIARVRLRAAFDALERENFGIIVSTRAITDVTEIQKSLFVAISVRNAGNYAA